MDGRTVEEIRIGGRVIEGISGTFAEGGQGEVIAYWGSGGWLEIGVREGSAQEVIGVRVGERVIIR